MVNARYPGFTDDEHPADMPCAPAYTPALAALPAHGAALGMRFYAPPRIAGKSAAELGYSQSFDAARITSLDDNQVLIAQHGSWNRRALSGYQVLKLSLTAGGEGPYAVDSWLSGFATEGGDICGRPADVLVAPDGAILVSDEQSGVVIRVSPQ